MISPAHDRKAKPVPFRSICGAFGTGYCWACRNPYWTGHYKTKREALDAARKKIVRKAA